MQNKKILLIVGNDGAETADIEHKSKSIDSTPMSLLVLKKLLKRKYYPKYHFNIHPAT